MYLVYKKYFSKLRNIYFRKIIKKYNIGEKKKILDYGCGPGDFILVAKDKGIDICGVDFSSRSVILAKSRGLEIIQGNYRQVENIYGDDYFDVIILQSVLEHVKNPQQELLGLKKLLKRGGIIIISSPTPSIYFWDDPTHLRPYTAKSFKILAEILEMEVVEINYIFLFLIGLRSTSRLFYLMLNILPWPLGSNLLGVYKKLKY